MKSYSNCSICVSFVSCNIITSSKLIHVVPRIRTSEFLFKERQNSFSRLPIIPFFVHTVFGLSIHVLVDLGSQLSIFSQTKWGFPPSPDFSFLAHKLTAQAPQDWVLYPPVTFFYTLPNDSIYFHGLKYPLVLMASGISVQTELLKEPPNFHPPSHLTALFMHISSCIQNQISWFFLTPPSSG